MAKHLVLIGGGHAHMTVMQKLAEITARGHRVTVIGPSAYHYYSGMGPGMLAGIYTPQEIRFDVARIVEQNGGTFLCDSVIRIDHANKTLYLKSGETLLYDVASCNTGSYVPTALVADTAEDVFAVKPIINLLAARDRILSLPRERELAIAVVGGGAAALEVAGAAWRLCRDANFEKAAVRLYAGKRFLKDLPQKIKTTVARSFQRRGIEIVEDGYVKHLGAGSVLTEKGPAQRFDVAFLSIGVHPSKLFQASGLPVGPDGGLVVNSYLQSSASTDIFGGGDCIYHAAKPLDKVGVYAVRQNPILFENLLATLEGSALTPFDPGGKYLLIFNLGDDQAIIWKGNFIFQGKIAFKLKDYIDRRFMRQFQIPEIG